MPENRNIATIPDPDPRVILAAERTLLAWIRTGLAMMGFGFVVARFGLFLRELAAVRGPVPPHSGLSLWVGTTLVLLGVLVNVMAAIQHVQSLHRLRAGHSLEGGRFSPGPVLSIVLAILGAAMAVYLILVR